MILGQWWNFFYMCGSAAATLTGLMFIAVSLGWKIINKDNLPQVNVFLSSFCFHFLHVFFLCCVITVPAGNTHLLAGSAIVSGFLRLTKMPGTYSLIRNETRRGAESGVELSDWVTIVILPTIVDLGLIAAGTGFFLDEPWAVYTLAACCLALLLGSARGAWDMLVWIATNLKEEK
jgi:hypothetical protein